MLTFTLVLSAAVFAIPAPRAQVVACGLQRHVMTCPVDVGLSAPLPFVVDTGTRRTVLDAFVASQLRLRVTPNPLIALDADVAAGDVDLPVLRFGPISAVRVRVSVSDLHALERATGIRAAGILGMDVLERANLTLDYARARVTIGVAEALRYHAALVWTSTEFAAVNVEIERRRLRLVIDTGADGILLFAGAVAGRVTAGDFVEAGGVTGISRLGALRVRQVSVAASRLRADRVSVADAAAAQRAYDGDGLLGIMALDARLIAFDFAHGELRWER